MLKQLILGSAIKLLFSIGLSIRRVTDKDALSALLKQLQPFVTDKELIRLGAKGDGGYLVPDDLEGIRACFSPGVGQLSSFEQDCVNHGMQVYLADRSVDHPAIENKNFHFIKKFIGPITNQDFITMDDWVKANITDNNSDLLLQMDIEGHEYFSIINMSGTLLSRFRIIIIEFHDLHKLWDKEFFSKALITFQKILQNHNCVHIHPNNCYGIKKSDGIEIPTVAEFTFIRKDRIKNQTLQTNFPHPLDYDNTSKSTIILPECWYNSR